MELEEFNWGDKGVDEVLAGWPGAGGLNDSLNAAVHVCQYCLHFYLTF